MKLYVDKLYEEFILGKDQLRSVNTMRKTITRIADRRRSLVLSKPHFSLQWEPKQQTESDTAAVSDDFLSQVYRITFLASCKMACAYVLIP